MRLLARYRLIALSVLAIAGVSAASVSDGGVKNKHQQSTNSIGNALHDEVSEVYADEWLPAAGSIHNANRSADDAVGSGDSAIDQTSVANSTTSTNGDEGNGTDWSQIWPYFNTGCAEWLPINHFYFQLANTCLFLSYLAPAGLWGLIYLRLVLAVASFFFALWGWVILCAFDTFLWNAFFTLINVVHGIYLLCSLRPVRFDKQVEEVYKTIFQPLKVSKQQFKKVVNCMKSIRPLKRGEHFAVEKQTRVESLSLLLSGSMLVIENGRTLHVLHPMQFVDSPEWFGVSSDDYFQVSIRACEESRVLLWHRDKLKLILLSDPFLQAVFDHILGRDVVRKLTQMKEKIASPSSGNTSPFRNNLITGATLENEKSPSLQSKASVHEHGHGLVVAPEQLTLLDETKAKKAKGKSANSTASPYDYSIVQHLDSTDI